MKLISVVLVCLALQGCWQVTNSSDLKRAVYFCKGVENISEIVVIWDGDEIVTCHDGAKAKLGSLKGAK